MTSLLEISKSAKNDPENTKTLIREFVIRKFDVDVVEVSINQSVVSLNSVNGFITLRDGTEYFFKFHAEEGETETVGEYYRAGVLEEAGLPVITPTYHSSAPGEQFLIYPKVTAPTFFDALQEMDQGFLDTRKYDVQRKVILLEAEQELCKRCADVGKKTLTVASSEAVDRESIWQLFYRRLVSPKTAPRIDLFYTGKQVRLPDGKTMDFEEFSQLQWNINGREYEESLAQIIAAAKTLLNPLSTENWPVITAHGDDHNGNKFLIDGHLTYFDPAFASTQIPALLAFIKTTFHDTFAHPFWLYEPEKIADHLDLEVDIRDGKIDIRHNFELEDVAPIRIELLKTKFKYLWEPVIKELENKNMLPENAREFIKKALFCCPFLVLNLIDEKRFTAKQSLFALSRAVEMGTYAEGNLVDLILDEII